MLAGKRMKRAVAALALMQPLAVPALAQSSYADQLHAGTLEVPLNKSQVVSTDRTIAKAMIGNSSVADVLPITDRSVYVLGKTMGTTSLTLYDSGGRVITVMDVAVGPDVQAFKDQANMLMPGEEVNARISGDSIILTGLVSSASAADRAVQLAKTYAGDKVVNLMSMRGSQQVMLEVRFAEVNRTSGFDIGSSMHLQTNNGKFNGVTGDGSQFITAADGTGVLRLSSITDAFGIFRTNFNIGALNIDSLINSLESKGLAKTLAEPTLIALSGQRASFLAGGEFPIPVAQSSGSIGGGQAITVEFKPFGVSLGFTPTVLGDKTINLLVEPEVSAIDPSASVTINGISVPGLNTRRASTTLELRDGESFAIAGLISKDFRTTVRQLPILGSIPVLGTLFRSSSFQKGETELLIVVTPHLVMPIRKDQVHLPTDTQADPTALDTVLMGDNDKGPKPAAPAPAATAPVAAPSAPQANAAAQRPAQTKGDGYEY
jgi:pilus assembly protein CpaC